MKSFVITLFIGVLSVQMGVGQTSLNDYHYVVVPDQFEFLKGKDQYQVNSLTVWLLNKNGFNAYLDSQLPLALRRKPCKGLKAVIQTKENFLAFKSAVVFTDCFGNIVYTSEEGRSKDKDYRKSYHEAIRQSFESITALNITQLPLDAIEDDSEPAVTVTSDESGGISSGGTPAVAAVTETEDSGGISSGGQPAMAQTQDLEDTDTDIYETIDEVVEEVEEVKTEVIIALYFKDYMLTPTGTDFDIHFKGDYIGKAKSTSNKGVYIVNTSQFTGVGYSIDQGFVIEREIEGMDQTIKMTFTRN